MLLFEKKMASKDKTCLCCENHIRNSFTIPSLTRDWSVLFTSDLPTTRCMWNDKCNCCVRNENFLKDLCCALDHARRFLAGVGGYISIFFATVPPCLTQTGRIEDHHLGRFGLMLVKHDGYREKSIYVIRDDEEGRYTEKTSVYITEAKK